MLANIGLEVVLEMFFFTLSRADVCFAEREFVWKTYTTAEVFPMTRRVEIIPKRKITVAALNVDDETFVMHVAALVKSIIMLIYLSYKALVATLISKEIGILAKYSDFSNVFSSDSAAELLEHTRINYHSINLLNNKHLPYGPIYSLGPMELETLKTHIKASLASTFITPSNFPASSLILFV